jgi:hypothetical protein
VCGSPKLKPPVPPKRKKRKLKNPIDTESYMNQVIPLGVSFFV